MEAAKKVKELKISKNELWTSIRKDWQLYSLILLPVIYLIIFKYGPMFGNIIAFRRFIPGGSIMGEEWVGLQYFKMFLNDPTFYTVFANTFILAFLLLVITFPAPIIFALLLNELKNQLFKRFVQTASYLPHFFSVVVVAGMVFEFLALNGPINSMIANLGFEKISFMQMPEWFRTVFVSVDLWQSLGWGAILYLAALTGINEELYEAARIDGANRWKQTIHITLPGILPTIVVLLILNIGNFLQIGFEKVLLLYNPLTYETGDVIATYVYRVGLESGSFSYGTAIGLFESVIGLVLVLGANYLSYRITDNSLW
ncbi:carbohydrate ABC transporter membrane protein 1, CUT1 family [Gracilibacillus orientalis]|uniref:Carbohydrate ABC transporter membrane protein 1, CUT1 family n=1 Tax=Gracilibacillus orientalis TaxID=334253 RepID=A0A1I4IBT0_9BACI|nr:ABC transporter permease subunit [Gracilibacillus orientalis]SFL51820.1 carbohydrate ABC transporter membrane protein 1, CUT1 family [Gracilibacillus orientalis]